MDYWKQELGLAEAAALRIERLEGLAEQRFDEAFAKAESCGQPEGAVNTSEFSDWMAARADTDIAWGRWAQVMHARPATS
jgi:hypothetical protein